MKNFKTGIVTFLILLLAPSLVFAAFPDVNGSSPYADSIDYVQKNGIVGGYPDGLFNPDENINRAEFVKILAGAMFSDGEIGSCKTQTFKDVAADAWYAPYVCIAKKNNIIDGYADGTFGGDKYIIFAEAAKILVNTLKPGGAAAPKAGEQWYQPYVDALSGAGAIPVEVYAMDKDISRGITAEIIYRLKENVSGKPSLQSDEVGDMQTIKEYYDKIASGDLGEAFAMKIDPGMSLEDYSKMYSSPFLTYIVKINKAGRHTYDFMAVTDPLVNDGLRVNETGELYQVEMEVSGAKIRTIYSKKLTNAVLEEDVFSKDLKATIEWDDGADKVFVYQGGQKKLVAAYNAPGSNYERIKSLYFSAQGNYLMYQTWGWEWGGVYLYDVRNKVLSDSAYQGVELYGMTGNEKFFYACSESGMGSGIDVIVEMPGFKEKRDLAAGGTIDGCGPYDHASESFVYKLFDDKTNSDKTYKYSIITDMVEEL